MHSMMTSSPPTEDSAIREAIQKAIQKAVAPEQWQALLARLQPHGSSPSTAAQQPRADNPNPNVFLINPPPTFRFDTHAVTVSVKKRLYPRVFNVLRCWSPVQSTIKEEPLDVTITVVFLSLEHCQGFFNDVQEMKSVTNMQATMKKSDYEEGPPAKKSKKSEKSENAENPENPETQENPDQA